MASTVVPVPKTSWLKKVGQTIGKIIGIVAKDAKPVADVASEVAEALLPQFSGEITTADNLVSKIAMEAIAVEGAASAAGGTAAIGQSKLDAVVAATQPAIDAWVQGNFPGAAQVSAANKAKLVDAVVAIINDVEGTSAVPTVPAVPAPVA